MKKNKEVFIIRHGKLLLPYKSHADMPKHVLVDLASTKINPPVDDVFLKDNIDKLSKKINLNELDMIYASPSRRCVETAEFIKDYIMNKTGRKILIEVSVSLSEVKFDLDKIYRNEKEFNFNNLNRDVLNAMVTGEGSESEKLIRERVNEFMNIIDHGVEKKILVIAHDFLMRVIEVCIKNKKEDKNITYKDFENTQRNDYLSGFKMDRGIGVILPIVY